MQYVDYHNAISDFSYVIFGQNPFFGAFLWRLIATIALSYYSYTAYRILYRKEDINIYVFFSISFLFLLIIRLPVLGIGLMNVDEAQAIATAARLSNHGRLFIDADGNTQGPVMLYILALLPKVNIALSYTSIRLFDTLFLWIPSLLLFYKTLTHHSTKLNAILGLLPFLAFVSILRFWDFEYFNTERIPYFFIFLALFSISYIYKLEKYKKFHYFILGLSCTLMSLAKLQSGPYSLLFFIIGIWIILKQSNKIQNFLLLICGVALPLILFYLQLNYDNSFANMKIRYIDTTLFYANIGVSKDSSPATFIDHLISAWTIFNNNKFMNLLILLWGFLIIKNIGGFENIKNFVSVYLKEFIFFMAFFFAAFVIIVKPANSYGHYGTYLIPCLFSFVAFFYIKTIEKINKFKHLYFLLFIPIALLILRGSSAYIQGYSFISSKTSNTEKYFKKNIPVNSLIAIWGWDNNLYLEANSMQATAISHTYFQMVPFKYKQYYIDQYIKEIRKSKAELFIDATTDSSFFFTHDNYRYELTPKVKEFVDANYKYDTTIDGKRFFKLKNHN